MTLHRLLIPFGGFTHWWYAAIPNERRGTLHILKVPFFHAEADRLRPPDYGYIDPDLWRQRYAGNYIPAGISHDAPFERVCRRPQSAYRWSYEHIAPERYGRGICKHCIDWQRTGHNLDNLGWLAPGFPNEAFSRRVQTRGSLTRIGEERWFEDISQSLYGVR